MIKTFPIRITFTLICLILYSCTSQEETDEFIGVFKKNNSELLYINSDNTFETSCSRFSCKNGTWDVSAFPTAMGIVITFYNDQGEFCEQLHWKKESDKQVLESQETEPEYIRTYQRTQ